VVQKSAIDVHGKFEPRGTKEGGDNTNNALRIKTKGATILVRQLEKGDNIGAALLKG
jgi:hypothetical protein